MPNVNQSDIQEGIEKMILAGYLIQRVQFWHDVLAHNRGFLGLHHSILRNGMDLQVAGN